MSDKIASKFVPIEKAEALPIGSLPSILTDIYQPEHNIAIWQRVLSTELQHNVELLIQQAPSLALVLRVTPLNVAEYLREKLADYVCADILSEDIAMIVDMFCCLFDVQEVGVRLTILDKPMCPKFHVDHVPCRLVTTYAGSATQWLSNQGLDRTKLGAGSLGQSDDCSGLFAKESVIHQMAMGDVALLKGSGWEGNENNGLVHRSPEYIPNERRLLLTIDFV
ncbi:DUF1826 domain-containing protein [Vibrio metschnikovii]|uniref:DUF1826 domain-containing protein n=1 Tax=Vibrio metschnikovii TaxID=28172 RepID=UPI001645F9CA|nr:DUF1826 domain-containing protein [Vibrio metschnikovii]MBC3618208.1 DUF1826 domain-containing protein [Vibrio metschnikovii]MBC3619521.1 DUF1826 domain-containing protein [Vibrio metschnikovii]MBC5814220.1 DUF1826 domain-containing protein [Vibrio metschnikovii]